MSATATRSTRARSRRNGAPSSAPSEPTIVIPPGCKPSKGVEPSGTRPTLSHGYLRRRKDGLWLCVTDAYMAAAIKVEGGATDGYVPIGALRLMEAGQEGEQIDAFTWKVQTRDGAVTFDITAKLDGTSGFPDFAKLGLWDKPSGADVAALAPEGQPVAVGMNPKLMARLADALGARNGCRFEITGPQKAIRVVPLGEFDRYGLQMPIRLHV